MSNNLVLYTPSGTRVLVVRRAPKKKTASGIHIVEAAQEKATEGIVVTVGSGRLSNNGNMVTPDYAPGDEVRFSKYAGNEMKIDGKDFVLLESDDIQGKVEELDRNNPEHAERIAAFEQLMAQAGYAYDESAPESNALIEDSPTILTPTLDELARHGRVDETAQA